MTSHPAITHRDLLFRLRLLFQRLNRSPKGVGARVLAGELEVSHRCIYRDIEILRNLGCTVQSSAEGFQITGYVLHDSTCPFCQQVFKASRRN